MLYFFTSLHKTVATQHILRAGLVLTIELFMFVENGKRRAYYYFYGEIYLLHVCTLFSSCCVISIACCVYIIQHIFIQFFVDKCVYYLYDGSS